MSPNSSAYLTGSTTLDKKLHHGPMSRLYDVSVWALPVMANITGMY